MTDPPLPAGGVKRKKASTTPDDIDNNAPAFPSDFQILVITHADPKKSLQSVSPFLIESALSSLFNTPLKAIRKTKAGLIIIETNLASQAKALLALTDLNGSIPVSVSLHESNNSVKAILRTWHLDSLSDDEIQSSLSKHNVISVKKLTKDNVTHNKPPAYLLTFSSRSFPEFIPILQQKHFLLPYYPPPLRCLQCLEYGHGIPCTRPRKCPQCAQAHDAQITCSAPMQCAACQSTEHNVRSPMCPRYQEEVRIMRMSIQENIPVPEARRHIRKASQFVTPGISFATAARNNNHFPAEFLHQQRQPLLSQPFFPSLPSFSQRQTNLLNQNFSISSPADPLPEPDFETNHLEDAPPTATASCKKCDDLLPAIEKLTNQVTKMVDAFTTQMSSIVTMLNTLIQAVIPSVTQSTLAKPQRTSNIPHVASTRVMNTSKTVHRASSTISNASFPQNQPSPNEVTEALPPSPSDDPEAMDLTSTPSPQDPKMHSSPTDASNPVI